jgi:photosystem II stability/assembly factor-like uncharacterized protein
MSRLPSNTPAAAVLVAAAALACAEPSSPNLESTRAINAAAIDAPTLEQQNSGTTQRLQAISPVNEDVAWASGLGGTFTLTTNGGRRWRAGIVPGAETLQFRDVHGVSAKVAYLLAAGVGTDSRIYKTVDGGETWELQFTAEQPNAFYDCFDFWTPNRALVMGDAVNERLPVLRTRNGGETWNRIGRLLPEAQTGEAAFAASGTCLETLGTDHAWIATGAAASARILATTDGGQTWKSYATPIQPQGTPVSGLTTVAFRDTRHGIIAGGDVLATDREPNNVAVSDDGGKTWELAKGTPFPGAAYGLSYAGAEDGDFVRTVVITGPGGSAWSGNEGNSWHRLPDVDGFWAVAFADPQHGWLVGTEGRIVKVSF